MVDASGRAIVNSTVLPTLASSAPRAFCAAAAFAALGCWLHAFAFYPGWLSFDSAFQLWQARHWHFNDLSPLPTTLLLALQLRLFDTQSAAPLFLMHLLAFWLGVGLFAASVMTDWKRFSMALLLFAFVTPLWWTLAHVWTDTAMLTSFALGIGMISFSIRYRMNWLHWLAIVPLLYASLVRLNSMPTALPLFAAWWITRAAFIESGSAGRLARSPSALSSLLVTLVLFAIGASSSWLINTNFANERVRTWPVQVLHDLVGISLRTGKWHVPEFARPPALELEALRSAYTPYVAVPVLLTTPSLRSGLAGDAFTDSEARALAGAWVAAIAREPLAYLAHRTSMMKRLLVWPSAEHGYAIGASAVPYRDNPEFPDFRFGVKSVVSSLAHPLWALHFSALPYLLLGIYLAAQLGIHVYRNLSISTQSANSQRVARDVLSAALLASAAIHVALLLVFSPASDARYLAWPICAIVLTALSRRDDA